MSTLYLIEPDSRLEKEHGRLLVTRHDEVLLRVPLGSVSRVVIVGRAGATTPALLALLEAGIPLLFVRPNGRLVGRLLPPTPPHLPLRRAQYARDGDADFCFRLARAVVVGKLRNQRTMVARLARKPPRPAGASEGDVPAERLYEGGGEDGVAVALTEAIAQASACADMDALRGIEGAAARVYFAAYRAAFAPEWGFDKRTRRPPTDPVNALLSLGYTFLTQAMVSALEVVGLDPYLGYFHTERAGRPALALDLVEEFRTPVADSLALDLMSHRRLPPEEFGPDDEGGVALSPRGLRVYLTAFSGKLESAVQVRELGRALSYRKLFEVQAHALARVVRGEQETYRSFRAR